MATKAQKAIGKVHAATRKGDLSRPESCELCERSKPATSRDTSYGKKHDSIIVAHHHKGYDFPLVVWWICQSCNVLLGSRTNLTKEQARLYVAERRKNPDYLRNKKYSASKWDREILDIE